MEYDIKKIVESRNDYYTENASEWLAQRLAIKGGKGFVEENLQPYDDEPSERVAKRKLLTRCEPICREAVEKVLQIASSGKDNWKKAITVDDAELNKIIDDDIDGKQKSVEVFSVNEILRRLLINGSCWVQADAPAVAFPSEEARIMEGAKPYLRAWWAQDVLNWVESRNGLGYEKVLVQYQKNVIDADTGFKGEAQTWFKLWTPETIYDVSPDNKIEEIQNTIGIVPFYQIKMDASFIVDLIDIQKDAVNTLGDLASFRQDANFGFYVIEGNASGAFNRSFDGDGVGGATKGGSNNTTGNKPAVATKPMTLSQNRVVVVKEQSTMKYVAPDTAPADFTLKYLERLTQTADKISNQVLRSASLTGSVIAQSGASKEQDQKPMSAGITAYLNTAVETGIEPALIAMAKYLSLETEISITPPSEFVVLSSADLIIEAERYFEQAQNARTVSATLAKYLIERYAKILSADATEELKSVIEKEISIDGDAVDTLEGEAFSGTPAEIEG